MAKVWETECIKNGFDGIYIIDHRKYIDHKNQNYSKYCSAVTFQQHSCAVAHLRKNRLLLSKIIYKIRTDIFRLLTGTNLWFLNYSQVVENAIDFMKKIKVEQPVIFQVSTGWDNTSRYGKNGYIINNASPEIFKLFLQETKLIAEEIKSEYIFLACWNEWCEGLVLEPTVEDGFAYLNVVKEVMNEATL